MIDCSDPKLGQRLAKVLDGSHVEIESRMTPSLAYGRHRGPSRDQSRVAAVVIGLFQASDEWMIPLTMRPKSLQHHGGQICLPGGRIEHGETPYQAALREYEEELGISPTVQVDCGELSHQYVFGSDNRVHPVVVTTETPSTNWVPDPIEVHEIILLPLATLVDPNARSQTWQSKPVRQNGKEIDRLKYSAPAIKYEEHLVWGATALILDELAQILQSLKT